jgi:TP901 family phage tail tape measure protein
MTNNWQINAIAGLDGTQSRNQLNSDIKGLARNLDKLKLYTEIDKNQVIQLQNQLKKLQIDLNTVTVTDAAINGLVKKINAGLQNITIGNINIGNVNTQAQQVGQQIGNNIAQGVNSGVSKATVTVKSFEKLTESMQSQKIIFNDEGLQNTKLTLDKIKETYAEFGQVKITNKIFNGDELQSFKVNIEQVNGELKETRSFMMSLSDNKLSFILPDDVIKGTEKYVQHLNAAKNATNATGEALNAQNQRLAEQAKYYGKIKEETNHLYSLKQKLLSADELQTAELNKQIKSTKQRITYNNQQLDKKGLRDNSLEREINDLVVAREKQLALSDAKAQDTANTKAQAQAQREANAVLKEQQTLQEKVNKIQLSFDTGAYDAKVQDLIAKSNQWTNANGDARISTENLSKALHNLNTAEANLRSNDTLQNRQALIQAEKDLDMQIKTVTNSIKNQNAVYAKDSTITSLHNKIQDFYDKNSATHRKWGVQLRQMLADTANGANLTHEQVRQISSAFNQVTVSARQAGKLGLSFFDTIKQGMKSFSYWTSSTFIVMKSIQEVKQVVSTVKELDNAMMDLTMATGYNKEQVEDLMDSYYRLGERFSATATDVAKSANTWLRQGKTIEETNKLIENSLILSKIGNISSEESTKYLTSAMKGYKVAVEDTLGIVDKLSAVDMVSATDVGGLAQGMSEVAASADLAGISMDKLLGYLAIVGETTQSGMSEVGTSFNAIFSRMGNIKLSRLKDYQNASGEDLSNVETVLRGEGISLRDNVNEFRNFGEVLDEVAGRWTSFSEVSQRAIASAFAG